LALLIKAISGAQLRVLVDASALRVLRTPRMSWRSGSALFIEIWSAIQSKIKDRDLRIEFTGRLLQLFVEWDMDPCDVEDLDPEVRAAMRKAGIQLSEAEPDEDDP
jgi:hypothetical protein